jgi:hypothetical protein
MDQGLADQSYQVNWRQFSTLDSQWKSNSQDAPGVDTKGLQGASLVKIWGRGVNPNDMFG